MKQFALVLFVIAALSPSARAVNISAVGVYGMTADKADTYSTGTSFGSAKGTIGGGLLVEFTKAGGLLGVETGVLMTPVKYTVNVALTSPATVTGAVTVSRSQLLIPLIVRFHLGKVFSLGAGAYYGIAQGKIKQTTVLTAPAEATTETEQTYSEAKYATSNLQGVGSLRMVFGGQKIGFLLEGQYLMGLKNVNTDTTAGNDGKVKTGGMQFLGGVSFML